MVVVLHHLAAHSLLLLHLFEDLFPLNWVPVGLPLLSFLLEQGLVLVLLKWWVWPIVCYLSTLLNAFNVLLSRVLILLLYPVELSQVCPLNLPLSLLKHPFTLLFLLHALLQEIPDVLLLLLLFLFLVVKHQLGLLVFWLIDHPLNLPYFSSSLFLLLLISQVFVVYFVVLVGNCQILQFLTFNDPLLFLNWPFYLGLINWLLKFPLKLNGFLLGFNLRGQLLQIALFELALNEGLLIFSQFALLVLFISNESPFILGVGISIGGHSATTGLNEPWKGGF